MKRRSLLKLGTPLAASSLTGCLRLTGTENTSTATRTSQPAGTNEQTTTKTSTPTRSPTPTPSPTPIATPSERPTETTSPTPSPTVSPSPTSSPTSTEADTPVDTPTESSARYPAIIEKSQVSVWYEYGDVLNNSVNSVGLGGNIYGAVRVSLQPDNGRVSYEWSGRLKDSDGKIVSESSLEDSSSVDSSDVQDYELWLGYGSVGLSKGTYELGFSVRDRLTGALDRTQIDIGIVEPLNPSEVSKVAESLPENATAGEEFDMSITLRSFADRDSSIVSPFSVKKDDGDWNANEDLLRWNVPGAQDQQLPYSDVVYDEPGTYTFRIDDYGIQWSVDVSPSS